MRPVANVLGLMILASLLFASIVVAGHEVASFVVWVVGGR